MCPDVLRRCSRTHPAAFIFRRLQVNQGAEREKDTVRVLMGRGDPGDCFAIYCKSPLICWVMKGWQTQDAGGPRRSRHLQIADGDRVTGDQVEHEPPGVCVDINMLSKIETVK